MKVKDVPFKHYKKKAVFISDKEDKEAFYNILLQIIRKLKLCIIYIYLVGETHKI